MFPEVSAKWVLVPAEAAFAALVLAFEWAKMAAGLLLRHWAIAEVESAY